MNALTAGPLAHVDEVAAGVLPTPGRVHLTELTVVYLEDVEALTRDLGPDALRCVHTAIGPVTDLLELGVHLRPSELRPDLEGKIGEEPHRRPGELAEIRRRVGH